MFCADRTAAFKRYQRRVQVAMAVYFVVILGAAWVVKHLAVVGWRLYFWSVLPAVPIMVVIVAMGRYLQEESDEYQRLMMMRSILVGTAALLGTIVVSDFVRAFAEVDPFPPFASFIVFAVAMAIAQAVQKLRDRSVGDE